MLSLQSYPACWPSGPGAWGVCSSSARLRPGWRCRTAGPWCTGCPYGRRHFLWGSSGTCAPPAPVTPWGKRTWRAHQRGRWTMSVRGTVFSDSKGHLSVWKHCPSEVTTQNLSGSKIGTSCEKRDLREVTKKKYPSIFVIRFLKPVCLDEGSYSDVGIQLQQGSSNVGRQGHVVADSALLGPKT